MLQDLCYVHKLNTAFVLYISGSIILLVCVLISEAAQGFPA